VVTKPSVSRALDELARYLTSQGVEYAHLPNDQDGKTGLDDYLIAHSVIELWRLVYPNPNPPRIAEPDSQPSAPTAPSAPSEPLPCSTLTDAVTVYANGCIYLTTTS
jgi:hypothetical protein